jgi:hypothetical protein
VGYLHEQPEVGRVTDDADLLDEAGEKIGWFNAALTDDRRLRHDCIRVPRQATFFRSRSRRMVGSPGVDLGGGNKGSACSGAAGC